MASTPPNDLFTGTRASRFPQMGPAVLHVILQLLKHPPSETMHLHLEQGDKETAAGSKMEGQRAAPTGALSASQP